MVDNVYHVDIQDIQSLNLLDLSIQGYNDTSFNYFVCILCNLVNRFYFTTTADNTLSKSESSGWSRSVGDLGKV